jgi:hypothetical protein
VVDFCVCSPFCFLDIFCISKFCISRVDLFSLSSRRYLCISTGDMVCVSTVVGEQKGEMGVRVACHTGKPRSEMSGKNIEGCVSRQVERPLSETPLAERVGEIVKVRVAGRDHRERPCRVCSPLGVFSRGVSLFRSPRRFLPVVGGLLWSPSPFARALASWLARGARRKTLSLSASVAHRQKRLWPSDCVCPPFCFFLARAVRGGSLFRCARAPIRRGPAPSTLRPQFASSF